MNVSTIMPHIKLFNTSLVSQPQSYRIFLHRAQYKSYFKEYKSIEVEEMDQCVKYLSCKNEELNVMNDFPLEKGN